MSKYTTGEIAKLCNVSVRTVQYYDSRGLLVPSELSEGGRRLYSEDDLKLMRVICFLREVGMPINSICELLRESNPQSLISILVEEQEALLKEEISERENKLELLGGIKKHLKTEKQFSLNSIGDVAHLMTNRKKLARVRWTMFWVALIMEAIEISTVVVWVKTGIWWPFAVGLIPIIALGIYISAYYFKKVAYICPQCHEVFVPRFREAFFAYHTPTARKLKCPNCNHKGYCVETYNEKSE